jgi:hypothetical protein
VTDVPSLERVTQALESGRSEDALDEMLSRLFAQLMAALQNEGVPISANETRRMENARDEAERCHVAAMAAVRQSEVVSGRVAIIALALGHLSAFHTELTFARRHAEPAEDRRWSAATFGALVLGISAAFAGAEGGQLLRDAARFADVKRGGGKGNKQSAAKRGAWRVRGLAHCKGLPGEGERLTNEQLADSIVGADLGCRSRDQALRVVGKWRRGGDLRRRVTKAAV